MIPRAGVVLRIRGRSVHGTAVVRFMRDRGMVMLRTRGIPMMRRTATGMMPGRAMVRHTHIMHMRGVVPVAAIPRRGRPVRHQARCRKRSKTEHRSAGCRVSIHRAAIGITENREATRIIAGIRPGDGGTRVGAAHRHRTTRVQWIIIYGTTTQHHRCTSEHGYIFHFCLHGRFFVIVYLCGASHFAVYFKFSISERLTSTDVS